MADAEYVSLTIPSSRIDTTDTTIQNAEEAAELKKRRTFRKFSYRGIDLDQYVSNSSIFSISPTISLLQSP